MSEINDLLAKIAEPETPEERDDALWAGDEKKHWPDIELFMEQIDTERASIQLLVGALSITLPIADNKVRQEFAQRCKERIDRTETPYRAERLLRGLM